MLNALFNACWYAHRKVGRHLIEGCLLAYQVDHALFALRSSKNKTTSKLKSQCSLAKQCSSDV